MKMKTKVSKRKQESGGPKLKSDVQRRNIENRDLNEDDQQQPTNAHREEDVENSTNQESHSNEDKDKTHLNSGIDIEKGEKSERIGEEDDELEIN